MTFRAGFGLGGGLVYSPDGNMSGLSPNNRCEGGITTAVSGEASYTAGRLTGGLEAGVSRNYTNNKSGFFADPDYGLTDIGARFGGSVGASVTIYTGAK